MNFIQPNLRKATRTIQFMMFLLMLSWPVSARSQPAVMPDATREPQATFTVNSTADATDFLPGNGVCETAQGNGICTLRAAVQETNALWGADTIQLPSGVYNLTIPAGSPEDATGDLDIGDNLTILGEGAATTVIDSAAANDRSFQVSLGIRFEISGVTIQNGGGINLNSGGGIFGNHDRAMVVVRDSILRDNHANINGGGIDIYLGKLIVENTLIEGNTTGTSIDANGGGIYNDQGTVTVTHSIVQNNQAGYFGGGISNLGLMSLSDSQVKDNNTSGSLPTSEGGGIYIYPAGVMTITRTTISGNTAAYGGGLSSHNNVVSLIQDSLIYTNTADHSGSGGGIFQRGLLNLDNVTISGNHSEGNGGGILNRGTTILSSVTLASNTAGNNGGGIYTFNSITATLSLMNTILAANTLIPSGNSSNCANDPLTSLDYNLVDVNSGCNLSGLHDQVADPLLGALGNNGGPTWTHALADTSPAIDSGNPGGCVGGAGALLTFDQRGLPRSVDGDGDNNPVCDVGAYEFISTDLAIAKTDGSPTAIPGTVITYTLTVTDQGTAPAPGVIITDTFPAGLTGLSWTCSGFNGAVCQTPAGAGDIQALVDMLPGSSATLQAAALVDPAALGSVTNDAEVLPAPGVIDPQPANNLASDMDLLTPTADLRLSISDAPDPVNPNGSLVYTLHVANDGPSQASSLTVTDTLTAGVGFLSAVGSGWGCTQAAGTVTCTRVSLAPGNAPDIFITVQAASTTGMLLDRARVQSLTDDPDLANNYDQESTTVALISDMQVTHAVSSAQVLAGYPLTFTLNVANGGPNDTSGVVVTDTLPAGVQFLGVSGSGWTCNPSSGVVRCSLPSLAVGPAPEIQIVVLAPLITGVVTNTAAVVSTHVDVIPGNNLAFETILVDPVSELSVAGSVQPSPPVAGQPFTYTLSVLNGGPNQADNAQLVDRFPSGAQFLSVTGNGWSCSPLGGVITCTLPSLAVGAAPLVQVAMAAPTDPITLTNTLSVTADSYDPDLGNNLQVSSIQVAAASDLAVGFVNPPSDILAGGSLTYTVVVTNAGPNRALDLVLTDSLPPGAHFNFAAGSGWTCSYAAGKVTCLRDSLGVGTSPLIYIQIHAPLYASSITNTASVQSATVDVNLADNSAVLVTPLISQGINFIFLPLLR
jgi:uncharacterized repeat protein (TIGR01451 family)/CSLREA domain-containing protein